MRSVSGETPEGEQGKPQDSSKFFQGRVVEVLLKAQEMIEEIKEKGGTPPSKLDVVMDDYIGFGYTKSSSVLYKTKVARLYFGKDGETLTSAFPLLSEGVPLFPMLLLEPPKKLE